MLIRTVSLGRKKHPQLIGGGGGGTFHCIMLTPASNQDPPFTNPEERLLYIS